MPKVHPYARAAAAAKNCDIHHHHHYHDRDRDRDHHRKDGGFWPNIGFNANMNPWGGDGFRSWNNTGNWGNWGPNWGANNFGGNLGSNWNPCGNFGGFNACCQPCAIGNACNCKKDKVIYHRAPAKTPCQKDSFAGQAPCGCKH